MYGSCLWIVKTLKRERRLSLRDINELWMKETALSEGVEMLSRTFHRYKKTLKDFFGIDISCEECGEYAYYITNPEILRDGNLPEWMLNTLSMDEKLRQCLSISQRIILEPIPSGGKTLNTVTDAMLGNRKLLMRYQPYGSTDIRQYVVAPYALTLYKQRWYILGCYDNGKIYTFGLDRMLTVEVTAETFAMDPSFDAEKYFCEFYGIYNSGADMTKIIFRAYGTEANYVRNLPIHQSQREIGCGEDHADFSIELRPNNELIGQILSRKNRLKVLSPPSFVRQIKDSIESMNTLYQ